MSLITTTSKFSTNKRSFVCEADPKSMEALEIVAQNLGATQEENEIHKFIFAHKSEDKNEFCLKAIEKIWAYISDTELKHIKEIRICHKKEILYISGDNDNFKVFLALLEATGKDIQSAYINYTSKGSYWAMYSAAEKLGLIPA